MSGRTTKHHYAVARDTSEEPIADASTVFYYLWDSSREAWIIGKDTTVNKNALIDPKGTCPEPLIIPRSFIRDCVSYPVEVIGQSAFGLCSAGADDPTKTIFITKQVKVIKRRGFYCGSYITNFTIEKGSKLEEIGESGIHWIGYKDPGSSLTPTLIFPSSLYSIHNEGIYWCDIFTTFIYCGTYSLVQNSSTISSNYKNFVLTLKSYPEDTIFGTIRNANKTIDILEECSVIKETFSQACFSYPRQTIKTIACGFICFLSIIVLISDLEFQILHLKYMHISFIK